MLKIRQEQVDILAQASYLDFLERMVLHVQKYFTQQYETMGRENIITAVQYGINKAESYGITSKQDINNFINIMFVLGNDFDTDPNLSWAKDILNDPSLKSGGSKMMLLDDAVTNYLDSLT